MKSWNKKMKSDYAWKLKWGECSHHEYALKSNWTETLGITTTKVLGTKLCLAPLSCIFTTYHGYIINPWHFQIKNKRP